MSTAQKKRPISKDVACVQAKASGLLDNYPMSSVLVVFAIGLGAGVALGSLLSVPDMSQPTLGRRTEQLGRQMLDAIAGVLPESLAKHIAA